MPRVAVIGCGAWGRHLVRNFAELGALAAVSDPNEAAASCLAEQYGVPAQEFTAILADREVEAVAIAAPPMLHFSLARQALEAGKHVFVEKPLALVLDEARLLCTLAERLDRRLMVGHLLQYHPAFVELKRLVREGRLGRLQYLYSNRLNLGRIRREEDILWSFAPHDISMILSLVGADPEKVEAVGGCYLHNTIADVTTTHLTFPAGERAHVFVSWLHPYKEHKLVVVGSEAMAVFDDGEPWSRKLLLYPHKVAWRENMPVPVKGEAEAVPVPEQEPLSVECRHFLDCVETGASPRTDGREGLRVLAVLDRATRSLGSGPIRPTSRVVGSHPGVMIHDSAYVDDDVIIGRGTRIWHFSHILSGVRIGEGTQIGQNVMIGPKVTVGSRVKIQNNVSIYEGVTIEDDVFCGPSCVFTNVLNPRAEIPRRHELRPTLVRRGATIGANATIVCGHTIGVYAFIAAGAVVTRDVPDYALMAGVPARRIGWVSRAGHRLGKDLVCPVTGERYRLVEGERLEPIEG